MWLRQHKSLANLCVGQGLPVICMLDFHFCSWALNPVTCCLPVCIQDWRPISPVPLFYLKRTWDIVRKRKTTHLLPLKISVTVDLTFGCHLASKPMVHFDSLFMFLLMFCNDTCPSSAPWRGIIIQSLHDLDFSHISWSLQDITFGLTVYDFLLVSHCNIWPNSIFARYKPSKSEWPSLWPVKVTQS